MLLPGCTRAKNIFTRIMNLQTKMCFFMSFVNTHALWMNDLVWLYACLMKVAFFDFFNYKLIFSFVCARFDAFAFLSI